MLGDDHDGRARELARSQVVPNRFPVPHDRPTALGPREEITGIIWRSEGVDDPQHRNAITEQANRYGGASHPPGIRLRAVIRIDDPEVSFRRAAGRSPPRLLTEVGEWKRLEQPGPDDLFGFRVGLCVTARAARSVRAVQVPPQEFTRLTSGGHGNFEGACVVGHCRNVS